MTLTLSEIKKKKRFQEIAERNETDGSTKKSSQMFIIFRTQKKFEVSKFQMTASFIQDLTFSQFHHDLVMN